MPVVIEQSQISAAAGPGGMDAADGLPTPRRYWAIGAIVATLTLASLDGSIANVALPTISREVDVSPAAVTWVVNSYQIVTVAVLLPLAALGESFGFRRVYLGGLVLFILGSLGCALSQSLDALIAGRVVQGFGAAAALGLTAGMVRHTYPSAMLGRAMGINAFTIATSTALAPVIATTILTVASWPWLFAVNIPIGLVALAFGYASLPHVRPRPGGFDAIAATLNGLTFAPLLIGLGLLTTAPWLSGVILLGAALAFCLLLRRQAGQATPMFPVDLLKIPAIAFSVSASGLLFAGQIVAFVALPFYFGTVMGRSQIEIGALLTPWPIATAIAAPLAGRLSDRVAPVFLTVTGAGTVAAGLFLVWLLPVDASRAAISACMLASGFGFGFFQTPNNRALISVAPRPRVGASGAILGTARLCGQTLGVSAIAVCFRFAGARGAGDALLIGAALAFAGACVSLMRGKPRRV